MHPLINTIIFNIILVAICMSILFVSGFTLGPYFGLVMKVSDLAFYAYVFLGIVIADIVRELVKHKKKGTL